MELDILIVRVEEVNINYGFQLPDATINLVNMKKMMSFSINKANKYYIIITIFVIYGHH